MTVARVLTLVLCALLAAGCGGSKEALGGGGDVDVCAGYDAYDRLPEPDPTSAPRVLAWSAGVLRVIERTQTDQDVRDRHDKKQPVPADVTAALAVLKHSMEQLQTRVRAAAADGPAAVRGATDALALDPAFTTADRRLASFRTTICR